jgi:dihydroxyacetone synthase
MVYAVDARNKLMEEGIKVRIVSFPCQRLFDMQTQEYKESVMQYKKRKPIVVIEAYAVNGWERYADAGYSMNSFGKSLPENIPMYKFFNFEGGKIAAKVKTLVDEVRVTGIESLRGNFRELNGGPMGYGWNPL